VPWTRSRVTVPNGAASVADTVALGPGDLPAAGPGDHGEGVAGLVVDVELGIVDIDVDQGVPVRVTHP